MYFRVDMSTRRPARRFEPRFVIFLLAAWILLPGCDSGSFLPPPPPTLADSSAEGTESKVRTVELVMTRANDPTHLLWEQIARAEAGNRGVIFNVSALHAGDAPSRQADLIRKAVEHGASALIVEPAGASGVVEALMAARRQGVAIVLLNKPLPDTASDEARESLPLVTHPKYEETGRAIADALVDDAKRLKLSAKGPALVLLNEQTDRNAQRRVDAMIAGLRARGVEVLPTLTFDGVPEEAKKVILDAMRTHPEISMVVAENDQGVSGAASILFEKQSKKFLLGGYVSYDSNAALGLMGICSAVVDRNERGLARAALAAALKILDGEKVASRIEIPMPVKRSQGLTLSNPLHSLPLDTQGANIIEAILKKARPQNTIEKQSR